MKILQICSYYGLSKLYTELNLALQRQGADTTFYVPTRQEKEIHPPEQNVVESVCFRNIDRYFFHWKHHKILCDLYTHLDPNEYSLAHAHSLFSNGYIAYRLKKKIGLPYIVAVRNTDINIFFRKMPHLRSLGIRILREAETVVFLSEAYLEQLLSTYIPPSYRDDLRKKSCVIPNGINAYWLDHKCMDKRPPDGKTIRVVFAGTIDKNKNLTATIKACQILREQGYAITYTAVGNILDQAVHKQLEEQPFAQYIPALNKEELVQLYKENDVFVMPSVTETFGLVYAEAMTQGLPVVYTRGQGFDHQFEEGAVGYSVDCGNPQEIADRILDCIGRYEEISSNCVSLCDKFNWDTIAQQYLELYSRIAGCAEHE